MNSRVKFLAVFLCFAFMMKLIGEFVHEIMGHGFFVLLFAIGGYIGGEMLYYSLWHYSNPEFSLAGAVFSVCIAVGYLMLKGKEKTSKEVELSEIT